MKNKSFILFCLVSLNIVIFSLHAKTVFTIGGAQKDVFISFKDNTNIYDASKKKKIEIKNPVNYTSTGGGAVNAAISFRRLGFSVHPILKLGTDERSKLFVRRFASEGICTDHIVYSDKDGTNDFRPANSQEN